VKAPKSLDKRVVMGRVAAPFGVKGWIKIQTFSEAIDTLTDFADWQIGKGDTWRTFHVLSVNVHTKVLVAELAGIQDRNAALALKGLEIAVPREALPPAAENEYYWSDLVGLQVMNTQGVAFGTVSELLESGAHDILVVGDAPQRLIPFVGHVVKAVDLAAGTIEVDWEADY
jgi:16S rRNA processing protein RimM